MADPYRLPVWDYSGTFAQGKFLEPIKRPDGKWYWASALTQPRHQLENKAELTDFLGIHPDSTDFGSHHIDSHLGQPLSSQHVWMHTGGAEGEPPVLEQPDWRPTDTIPEDFYAYEAANGPSFAQEEQTQHQIGNWSAGQQNAIETQYGDSGQHPLADEDGWLVQDESNPVELTKLGHDDHLRYLRPYHNGHDWVWRIHRMEPEAADWLALTELFGKDPMHMTPEEFKHIGTPDHQHRPLTPDERIVAGIDPMPEVDWRPNETIPEDFYAFSRGESPVNYNCYSFHDVIAKLQRADQPVTYNENAFLEQIRQNPNDFTNRAVFADWLEDQEHPDRNLLDALRSHQGFGTISRTPQGFHLDTRSRAQQVGERVGRAMAESAAQFGDDLRDSPNGFELDSQDADQLHAAGIEFGSPEWREAENHAERAFLEHFNPPTQNDGDEGMVDYGWSAPLRTRPKTNALAQFHAPGYEVIEDQPQQMQWEEGLLPPTAVSKHPTQEFAGQSLRPNEQGTVWDNPFQPWGQDYEPETGLFQLPYAEQLDDGMFDQEGFLLTPKGASRRAVRGIHFDPEVGNYRLHGYWINRDDQGNPQWWSRGPSMWKGPSPEHIEGMIYEPGDTRDHMLFGENPDRTPVSPEHLWALGLGGQPPQAPDAPDWRTPDTVPEDFYAYGRADYGWGQTLKSAFDLGKQYWPQIAAAAPHAWNAAKSWWNGEEGSSQHAQNAWDSWNSATQNDDDGDMVGYGDLSSEKAREILHDGTVHGHPITDKQRRFFGWKSHQTDYADELNQDENNAFIQTIHANPLDATNHLVHSDWLRDRGHHDEAEFRQAMGEWVKGWNRIQDLHKPRLDPDRPWMVPLSFLPGGIVADNLPGARFTVARDYTEQARQLDPHTGMRFRDTYHYPSYPHMEEAFRRAFHQGRGEQTQASMYADPYQYPSFTDMRLPPATPGTGEMLDPVQLGFTQWTAPGGLARIAGPQFMPTDWHSPSIMWSQPNGEDYDQFGQTAGDRGEYARADYFLPAIAAAAESLAPAMARSATIGAASDAAGDLFGGGDDQQDYAAYGMAQYGDEEDNQAFLNAIHANPLDATNHLVHADWLDERGQHGEAAFRRAMGEWAARTSPHLLDVTPSRVEGTHGISTRAIPSWVNGRIGVSSTSSDPNIGYSPNSLWTYFHGFGPMEEAFRRAFHANQNTVQPGQIPADLGDDSDVRMGGGEQPVEFAAYSQIHTTHPDDESGWGEPDFRREDEIANWVSSPIPHPHDNFPGTPSAYAGHVNQPNWGNVDGIMRAIPENKFVGGKYGYKSAANYEGEEEAFQQAIHQNPFEFVNHGAYADWLREQGRHEDADFRTNMGEWMQSRAAGHDNGFLPVPTVVRHTEAPQWAKGKIRIENIFTPHAKDAPFRWDSRHVGWDSYPQMEEALRRAHDFVGPPVQQHEETPNWFRDREYLSNDAHPMNYEHDWMGPTDYAPPESLYAAYGDPGDNGTTASAGNTQEWNYQPKNYWETTRYGDLTSMEYGAYLGYADDQYEDEHQPESEIPVEETTPTRPELLNGALVSAALKPSRKRGPNVGQFDRAAMGALGDHLQEIGNPLGVAVSHFVRTGQNIPFSSLSGTSEHEVSTADGSHQVFGRRGISRDGKPIVWTVIKQNKPRQHPDGRIIWDSDKSHSFAVPAELFDQPQ